MLAMLCGDPGLEKLTLLAVLSGDPGLEKFTFVRCVMW